MAVYKYSATDAGGNRRVGAVDARTEDLALSLLKNQGLFVINLVEQKEGLTELLSNFMGVSDSELVAFTRQFSTMISAGLPLARSLEVLAEQSTNKNLRKIITDVLRDVEGGAPLSSALGRYPKQFSSTYRALVKAGESSGKLDEILKRLANTMEAERELKAKFKSAMIYPAIVMIAMVGVFIILMIFVVPQLADMYISMGVDLPFATKMMIGISNFMTHYFYVLIAVIAGGVLLMRSFLSTPTGRELKSVVLFNMPVFGKLNRLKDITQFTRTLSLLIGSAIPIVEALKIVSNVVSGLQYQTAANEAARVVEKGTSLSEYFKYNKEFPPLLGQMVAVGEETGQLDEVLEKVANYFNGEVDHAVEGLSAALEPIILIVLGSMVGFLILSIITPIYQITTSL
jgi:type IV pilus assembly protein PilC